MPKRIQRKRTKGWKMPDNCVSVTRPGPFGNPFDTAERFREVLLKICSDERDMRLPCGLEEFGKMMTIAKSLPELRGKDLACWCEEGHACHADVLLELANA